MRKQSNALTTDYRLPTTKKQNASNCFHSQRRVARYHSGLSLAMIRIGYQQKSPCPLRARTLLRGTTLHLYSVPWWYQKAPVHYGTGANSRYHPALYFHGLSVTGTSALTYYLRPRSSRVIDCRSFAPAFTIRRLSEANNQLSSRSQHVLQFEYGHSIQDERGFVNSGLGIREQG